MDLFSFAHNSAIDIGEGIKISVQASSGHYCSPRTTLKDLFEYDDFEILISYNDCYLVVVNDNMRFSNYEAYIEEEDSSGVRIVVQNGVYIITGGCPVAGYVPGEVVDSIINDLNCVAIKIRSRNVLFEKTNKMYNFFRIL